MKLRIRSKFVGILAVASLLPLGMGLAAFRWFGEHYYREAQGLVMETEAANLALALGRSLRLEIDALDQWIDFGGIAQALKAEDEPSRGQDADAAHAKILSIEEVWEKLPPDAPEIARCLNSPLADQLRAFQRRNPNFAELFATDSLGRLVAATQKTSDYWQADEKWWQETAKMRRGAARLEGPNYDQSAGVYSIDIAVPVFDGNGRLTGVLKGVLNVSPLFKSLPHSPGEDDKVHEIVLEEGVVLMRLRDDAFVPFSSNLGSWVVNRFQQLKQGWSLEKIPGVGPAVTGFAPVRIVPFDQEDLQLMGLSRMWAVVYRPDSAVMAPVHARIRIFSLVAAGLIAAFLLLGYQIASRMIIGPINSLRLAAGAVSRTVRLDEAGTPQSTQRLASRESAVLMEHVEAIKTGDEIEDLAQEFSFMGQRILSYHEKLENEIAEQTREMRLDLDFAREFQANLMPSRYPEVPSQDHKPSIKLDFHHIYKPASTVGGDFFNVLKLGDSRAGIFIADVMGHGARSALVTAIVATLLQDAGGRGGDPAGVLHLLNRHFHKVVHSAGDVVFVSAFYLVLDVAARTASYASAGHPSPLLLDRTAGEVIELTPGLSGNPALGLFPDSAYQSFSRPIKAGDLFLLFTDGLFECTNAAGEDFGRRRLVRTVEKNRDSALPVLAASLVSAAEAFAGSAGFADDVCLVAVDVCESAFAPSPVRPAAAVE